MIIAIPVDEKNMETNVGISFGRASYFHIYNTETKESSFIDNGAATCKGGAGIVAAQIVVDSKVSALLTPRCGEKAAEVLKAADVKLYKTSDGSTMKNINNFIDGKLSKLDEIHAGFHGHGDN